MTNPMNRRATRRALLAAAGSAVLAPLARTVRAQPAWPTRPVRVIVGFAPGGTTDIMARVVAQGLGDALGQSFIVENRPGASGNIASGELIKAAPDGYTILVAPTSVVTANPYLFKMTFDPAKDMLPVGGIGKSAMYVVTRPDLAVKDARELVQLAKATPGKLTYASAGAGTPPHLAAELFKAQTGAFVTHLPYRGAAPALQDVMAGHADYVFDPGIAFPHIRAGKVKLVAVASAARSPFFPETSTLAEQGIRGAELDIWFGAWAPIGTTPEIVATLNRELAKVLAAPAVRQRFGDLASEPAAIANEPFRKLLADEARVLGALVRERGISVD